MVEQPPNPDSSSSASSPHEPIIQGGAEPDAANMPRAKDGSTRVFEDHQFLAKLRSGIDNLYAFNLPEGDRSRLVAQAQLFSQFVQTKARTFIPTGVQRFLDVGCGEGQLTVVLGKTFPNAQGVGTDIDAAAIENAKKKVSKGIPGLRSTIDFMVENANEKLPDGPFDLIYVSVVLLFLRDPEKTLSMIYSALAPGGYVWIKDVQEKSFLVNTSDSLFTKMAQIAYSALQKTGVRVTLADELPQMLTGIGFQQTATVPETYELSAANLSSRIALSNMLSLLYNLSGTVTHMEGIPEQEYLSMHSELSARADNLKAKQTFPNFVARRPLNS